MNFPDNPIQWLAHKEKGLYTVLIDLKLFIIEQRQPINGKN